MQTLEELNDHFAIPGALTFVQGKGGLIAAQVATPACRAEIYLHGAHLTAWQPAGHPAALFLSDHSDFTAGKPIRGGVPIIFPWFGARSATLESSRTDGPSHGFARISLWRLEFAGLAGDDLHLSFTLSPNETSRSLGFDHFQLAYELSLGAELRMRLTVANQADTPFLFEEALHTYFAVGDATQVQIRGLDDMEYLDKTAGFQRKCQTHEVLKLIDETDRPYLNTAATVTLDDPMLRRRIVVAKSNSLTTVVWNPWSKAAAKLPDMTPDSWRNMTCIETANALENGIILAPHHAHTMEAHISIQKYETTEALPR